MSCHFTSTTDTVRATVTGILLDGDVSTVQAAHDRHLREALRHPAMLCAPSHASPRTPYAIEIGFLPMQSGLI
jgi:hypothetical protein